MKFSELVEALAVELKISAHDDPDQILFKLKKATALLEAAKDSDLIKKG